MGKSACPVRKKRCVLNRGRGPHEQSTELVEPQLRLIIVRQSSGTFHLADERI
jgi:hypothetical protein